ncbi:coiled-coil domain-containing protein 160 homolog isoform X2 [Patiria miniata]|nr:coiled-coil domain-containing protein 160 homolog isoform X2 [Patiria miniata]
MEKHWVEDLFPPFYTFSLGEDETASPRTASPSQGKGPNDEEEEEGDLKRIQKLYDRVRIELNRKEKEARQKCIQVGEPLKEHLPQTSPCPRSTKRSKERKKTPSKRDDDECIWTAEELEILRKAAEEAKQENSRLQAELIITGKQRDKLARKCRRQSAALAAKDTELLERKQETGRLSLRCHHLETELKHSRMTAKFLEEDIGELREGKRRLQTQLKDVHTEFSDEKLTRVKLESELQRVNKKNALESIVREDGIRLDYERQIKSLYEELEEARTKLEKQKTENGSIRKALDHLRIHFASLPSRNARLPKSQESDELGQLDLY